MSFYYNADRQKFARVDETANKTATTYYLGNYELVTIDTGKTIITQQKAYIGSNTIYIETKDANDSKNNKTEIYEALHDNLGSVTDITDENGSVKQHFSYLPFGEQKQTKGAVPYHPVTYKGFTGHEQIDVAGINLIHMDGRIYDPVIGRFLSADPFVQDPGNSQCLNRYSYCINNPLAFTDPTGFGFWSRVWHGITNVGSAIAKGFKAVVNSTVGRIVIGVAVAVITYFTCGLDLLAAAAIGGATTSGIGLAAGVGWKQALGEGFLAATIFGAIGTIAESYKSAHDPGPINVPTPTPNNDKPMQQEPGGGGRAPQGHDFVDPASSKSFEDAAPSGNAFNYMNILPSMMSDRSGNGSFVGNTYASSFGDYYNNGAKSDAYVEAHNNEHTFAQRCEFCWNGLKHDPIAQTSAALTISALPIPKSLLGYPDLRASRFTSIYSVTGKILTNSNDNIKSMLTTESSLVLGNTRTTNIPRYFGRVAQVAAPVFLISYSATRMFRCITEQWDQPEK